MDWSSYSLETFINHNIEIGTTVVTDKLNSYRSFIDDPITEILRQGARKLLAQALETEIEVFINQYKEPISKRFESAF